MCFYIIKKKEEYIIYKVKPEDVLDFNSKYEKEILVKANNLMELLISFERDILFGLNYQPDMSENIHPKRK